MIDMVTQGRLQPERLISATVDLTEGVRALERMGDFSSALPRKRLGVPAQLDSTLLYLCSPSSDAVTGTIIRVDDGQGSR